MSQQRSLMDIIYVSSAAALVYWVLLAIYRVYLSPLSRIPGPRLAALTYWYETYYEVYKGGQYFRMIDNMHGKYGPIVRITPNEVHFEDPTFNDVLYPSLGKRKIDRPGLEPILQDHMERMLFRMQESGTQCEVVELHYIFKACASDIITLYAFGDSFHFLDQSDYGVPYFRAGEAFNSMTHVFGAFPWLLTVASSAPGWLLKYLNPDMAEFVDRREWWIEKVRDIRNSKAPERAKNTIFGGILDSSLPPEDKTDMRLANEAQLVVFAGEGTTAIFHLLSKPGILQKMKEELAAVVSDGREVPTFQQMDKLRYMNAIINEAIRLHPGAMHRQVRVCPNDAIVYVDKERGAEYVVPPGTVYGTSPLTSHMNESVFKDPYEFIPERWIDNPEISKAFMGFSRGTRGCVGITLARRELSTTLATIFLKYDLYQGQQGPTLELYDTIRARDIDAARDYISPLPTKGSFGLRVRIRN
ncbi:cytochrome P450 [Colletotrichum graminicola M1.001]|uniref:Cytochrome P450 n=1 Tax=Colletotrichum graminicola (strain M1.001 / M2 / FGSC 10212) TaxID=645133 RepID=E3QX02_COLGM|nr:cytochrome P450 [Colletotrichum graminicola M1.001]EFQ35390.1 cytochrome P450 [Colletotrichum graminicola M1.001]